MHSLVAKRAKKVEPQARAKRGHGRPRQIASGLVLLVAVAFVVISTWEITMAVWEPARAVPSDPRLVACSEQLRPLASALERAADKGSAQPDTTSAMREFDAALEPEWQKVKDAENLCSETPAGLEAYASLLRLRRGLEGQARRAVSDIEPLRRDFQARLR